MMVTRNIPTDPRSMISCASKIKNSSTKLLIGSYRRGIRFLFLHSNPMPTSYIVCDACYILNDKDYSERMMPLWFPPGKNVFNRDISSYGGDIIMTDINDNPIKLLRSLSTNSGDCSIEWLGCDAGNFSLFESEHFHESPYVPINMFRFFDNRYKAEYFLERLISLS